MVTYEEIKSKMSGVSLAGSSPSIDVNLAIKIPFVKVLDQLLEQVRIGLISADQYYAYLDLFEHNIESYRNAKLR